MRQDTIYSLLREQAEHSANHTAIFDIHGNSLTYRALIEQVEAVVEYLQSAGIGRTDTVATVIRNGPNAAVCCLGVSSGAICAPLNPVYSVSEFESYFRDLAPKALIVDLNPICPAVQAAHLAGIPVITLTSVSGEMGRFRLQHTIAAKEFLPSEFPSPDDIALLLYTTGSTSGPKLVPITHRNLCNSAIFNRDCLRLTTDDCCLNVMPLFHIHGLAFAVLTSFSAGSSVICAPGFNALHFYKWLLRFRPTWYTAAPTIHQALLRRAAENPEAVSRSRLRFIRSGASALPTSVMEELENTFAAPVIEAYAMTEAGLITINRLPPERRKPGSVGLPAGCEVAIVDEHGCPLCPGETGHVVLRGGSLTSGYLNNPEANLRSFVNGWFYTGDRGRLDSDGYLFLTGRTSEIINRAGEKISPWEIDNVLMRHPAVHQAAAFAVPDESLGERIAVGIVLREPETEANRKSLECELQEFAAQYLAPFKVPQRVIFIPEIPKGPTGKPQRKILAATLLTHLGLSTFNSCNGSSSQEKTKEERAGFDAGPELNG